MREPYQNRIEFLQGTLDMIILQTLCWCPRRGWLKSEWKQSENKQPTKVYSLTAKGKKQLTAEQERWNRMTIAIAGLMNAKESNA